MSLVSDLLISLVRRKTMSSSSPAAQSDHDPNGPEDPSLAKDATPFSQATLSENQKRSQPRRLGTGRLLPSGTSRRSPSQLKRPRFYPTILIQLRVQTQTPSPRKSRRQNPQRRRTHRSDVAGSSCLILHLAPPPGLRRRPRYTAKAILRTFPCSRLPTSACILLIMASREK
ncbi:hypothetical protein BC827DRAFT_1183938 [Russula dissimulans]|nr:hypothetical protein BC827DRAFT_1183938 [Russula dissimulans]